MAPRFHLHHVTFCILSPTCIVDFEVAVEFPAEFLLEQCVFMGYLL